MIKMKNLINEMNRVEVSFVSPEDTTIDYFPDLNRMQIQSGIFIYGWNHLSVIAVKDNRAVGALFTGVRGDTYSFDVIIDKNERGKGIGAKLIRIALDEYREISDQYKLELQVVNARLIPHLEKLGLEIVRKHSGMVIMAPKQKPQ